jgi:uncharacterized SAM-binding protein YcdF (DUF218 family)
MFFYPSKLFWFVAQPTNALVLLGLFAALLMFTRFLRPARWLALTSALGLIAAGFSPLPYALMRPLEDRFARPDISAGFDGMIVLGGAIGSSRGLPSLNDAAARMTDSATLALSHPGAMLAFTGGDAGLLEGPGAGEARTEAEAAAAFFTGLRIAPARLILEDRSRNTHENAIFLKPLLPEKPGARWLLITSAWHMPRAVGVFRQAGIAVIPYPVDYTTQGTARDFRQLNRSFSFGLQLTDLAVKEWIGLVAYRLAGYTDALLPAPR